MFYILKQVIDGRPHFFEGEYEDGYKWSEHEEFACEITTMKRAREMQADIGGIIVPVEEKR